MRRREGEGKREGGGEGSAWRETGTMRCPSRAYLPVDGLEERMCFDVLDPVCPVPQPVLWVSLEEDS